MGIERLIEEVERLLLRRRGRGGVFGSALRGQTLVGFALFLTLRVHPLLLPDLSQALIGRTALLLAQLRAVALQHGAFAGQRLAIPLDLLRRFPSGGTLLEFA
jgi:hypothetical protein